jgi:Ca2+-binding RTX toxin-like protein
MNIEVKGTKTTHTTVDPAARYAQVVPERLSAVPKVLALAFVSVALYLKSIFPTLAEGTAQSQGQSKQGDPAAAPTAQSMGSLATREPDTRPADAGQVGLVGSEDPANNLTLSVSVAVIRLTDIIHRVDRVALDSVAITIQPDLADFFRSTIVSNDNESPVANAQTDPSALAITMPVDDQIAKKGEGKEQDLQSPDDNDRRGTNRAPRVEGPVQLYDVIGGSILLIGLVELLRHTVDPNDDQLFVLDVSVSSGEISEAGLGWAYQADGDYTQSVVVSYKITDGEFEVSQTAHFTAVRPWVQGTEYDDLLIGTTWADDISADAGNDNIDGRQGNDVISGGAGDDHILGGAGHDTIFGGSGDDILLGQDGNDHLFGGFGDDRLFGGAGNDLLVGAEGADTLDGGDGDDLLQGGVGDDFLLDGAGNDVVFGGAGADVVLAEPDAMDDWFFGGDGVDTIDYSGTTDGIVIDLHQGLATGVEIGTDLIESFEHAIGGAGDDHFIVGASTPSILSGGAGDNTFEFIPEPENGSKGQVSHEITDFKYGDKLKMSHYKLFDKVMDEIEDEFEAMYGDDIDDDDIPIRVRQDTVEDIHRTIIEADFDRDNVFETTVFIQGHHVLVITDMTA